MTATKGRGDALQDIMLAAARVTERLPDCHLYVVQRVPDEPDTVRVTEVWENQAAHAASLAMPEVRELIASARPLIAAVEHHVVRPVGGKGLGP
ncbi:MAG: antibiotic biosynthesis monooxygenase [Gammaproteobacteria bacterium]|nr:antibiotic biosynthesis monooxygenase [Gammaproteobacteria bacterium]MDH4255069.1 antibiotic biosynthesis monooxygenase [Gammaproteobacteria bacterium]MDH5309563.1 antibiotic biosynthesis monooxygenase [Gammaproteobacteria bacterium]